MKGLNRMVYETPLIRALKRATGMKPSVAFPARLESEEESEEILKLDVLRRAGGSSYSCAGEMPAQT
jgi:hypothetical protein